VIAKLAVHGYEVQANRQPEISDFRVAETVMLLRAVN
jgi:hypothetical protein